MTRWFTVAEFEQLCFDFAREMEWVYDEPIPAFHTRYPGKLESCLETPKQSYGGALLYPSLLDQATILFYLLIKNHPFVNGNKRVALIALLLFLDRNGLWLFAGDDELFDMTIYVAKSDAREMENVLEELRFFVNLRLRPARCFRLYYRKLERGDVPEVPRRPKRRGKKFKGFPRLPRY
jgi:prophage maintenance system killer protein